MNVSDDARGPHADSCPRCAAPPALKGRPAIFTPFLALIAAGCMAVLGTVPAAACDRESMAERLRADGFPVQQVEVRGPGRGIVLHLAGEGRTTLTVGFGFLADGTLSTRTWNLSGSNDPVWAAVEKRLIEALRQFRQMPDCPALLVEGPIEPDQVGRPGGQVTPAGPAGWMAGVINYGALIQLLAWLVLVVFAGIRGARARPAEALALAAMVGLALLVRFMSSDRLPMGAANGDLTHFFDIRKWLGDGLGAMADPTYPPAYRVLLYGLFRIGGPSIDLAFVTTTIVGSLNVIPAWIVARSVTGSSRAGFLAALALATYPASIFFSNGIGLEPAAGLFLGFGFVHVLSWIGHRRPVDLVLWALAMSLLAQSRIEAIAVAVVAGVIHLAMVAEAGSGTGSGTGSGSGAGSGSGVDGFGGGRGGIRGILPGAGLAILLVVPYAIWLGTTILGSERGPARASGTLPLAAAAAGIFAIAALLAHLLDRGFERRPWLSWIWGVPILGTAVALVLFVAVNYSGNAFWPAAFPLPGFPFTGFHIDPRFGAIAPWPGPLVATQAGVFPILWILLIAASWLPSGVSRQRLPFVVLALPMLVVFGYMLTGFIQTGIAPVEGLRHHVPFAVLIAISAGIGSWRLIELLGLSTVRRSIAAVVVLLVLAAPVATHREFVTDTLHNPQREFAFARDVVASLPPDATLLMPDDEVTILLHRMGNYRISEVFRTAHLLQAVAADTGKFLRVQGVRQALREPQRVPSEAWFFLGVDCYRVPAPDLMLPSCERVRQIGAAPLVEARFPNRMYSMQNADVLGIRVPEIRIGLYRLDAVALGNLGDYLRAHPEPLGAPVGPDVEDGRSWPFKR